MLFRLLGYHQTWTAQRIKIFTNKFLLEQEGSQSVRAISSTIVIANHI